MTDEDEDIEIISTEDDKIKLIGEIFSNDSSRTILKLVSNGNEMTANEMAQESGMSLALTIHHLKRMHTAGMIRVSKTGISAKGQEMKYYVATKQSFLITPEKSTNSVVDSLKKFSKFAAIGMAGVVSWMTLKPNTVEEQSHGIDLDSASGNVVSEDETRFSLSESDVDSSEMSTGIPSKVETEPEPQPEPSDSLSYFDFSSDTDVADTGSTSLDQTVYPQPFDAAIGGESLLFAIIVSLGVVVGGIILERILARWYNKRKQNKKLRGFSS